MHICYLWLSWACYCHEHYGGLASLICRTWPLRVFAWIGYTMETDSNSCLEICCSEWIIIILCCSSYGFSRPMCLARPRKQCHRKILLLFSCTLPGIHLIIRALFAVRIILACSRKSKLVFIAETCAFMRPSPYVRSFGEPFNQSGLCFNVCHSSPSRCSWVLSTNSVRYNIIGLRPCDVLCRIFCYCDLQR